MPPLTLSKRLHYLSVLSADLLNTIQYNFMISCSPRNQKTLELLVKVIQEGMGRSPSTSSTPAMVHIWRNDPPVLHQDASCQLPHVKRWPAFLAGSRDLKGRDRGIPDGQKCIVDQHLRKKILSTYFFGHEIFLMTISISFSLPWGIWVRVGFFWVVQTDESFLLCPFYWAGLF